MTLHPKTHYQRFPPSLILRDPVHLLAFGLGSGLSPWAPGTAGTLVGIPLYLLLDGLSLPAYVAVVVALTLLGAWITGISSRRLGVHDHGGIVLDEIVAYLVAVLPLLPALGWWTLPHGVGLVAAFLLFRLFDVIKPWPIHLIDRRLPGGLGIMLDDAAAGALAALVLGGLALLR